MAEGSEIKVNSGVSSGGQNIVVTPNIEISSTLKLPSFWFKRPDLWFLQVETQFRLKGIKTESTKYDHLVSALTEKSMEIVADVLANPPLEEKYRSLKKTLISRCQDSEERRLNKILNRTQMGDLKPFEFFRHLESVAGDKNLINSELLKKLWLNKLPAHIQP